MHEVFVYGTLKRGFHNNFFLSDAEFVCESYSMERFEVYTDGGPIPYVTANLNPVILPRRVQGEVFRVNDLTLAELDALEGNGTFYKRRLIQVQFRPTPCWCYFIMHRNTEPFDRRDYRAIQKKTFSDGTPVSSFEMPQKRGRNIAAQ